MKVLLPRSVDKRAVCSGKEKEILTKIENTLLESYIKVNTIAYPVNNLKQTQMQKIVWFLI